MTNGLIIVKDGLNVLMIVLEEVPFVNKLLVNAHAIHQEKVVLFITDLLAYKQMVHPQKIGVKQMKSAITAIRIFQKTTEPKVAAFLYLSVRVGMKGKEIKMLKTEWIAKMKVTNGLIIVQDGLNVLMIVLEEVPFVNKL